MLIKNHCKKVPNFCTINNIMTLEFAKFGIFLLHKLNNFNGSLFFYLSNLGKYWSTVVSFGWYVQLDVVF